MYLWISQFTFFISDFILLWSDKIVYMISVVWILGVSFVVTWGLSWRMLHVRRKWILFGGECSLDVLRPVGHSFKSSVPLSSFCIVILSICHYSTDIRVLNRVASFSLQSFSAEPCISGLPRQGLGRGALWSWPHLAGVGLVGFPCCWAGFLLKWLSFLKFSRFSWINIYIFSVSWGKCPEILMAVFKSQFYFTSCNCSAGEGTGPSRAVAPGIPYICPFKV